MSAGGTGFFTQLLGGTREVWSKLSVPQRVTLGMFFGTAVLLVLLVSFWSNRPDFVPVTSNLSPEESAEASAKLRDAQIPFRYETSRGTLSVPSGRIDDARGVLAELGLSSRGAKGEGFELFDRNTFGMTEFEQRVNYLRALQGSLERKIKAMDGIEEAHVTLTLPKDELFVRDRQAPKASVEVRLRRMTSMNGGHVAAIRHLVASAVPQLTPQNVAVMDHEGRMLARFQDANDPSIQASEHLEARIKAESYLKEKVEELLGHALGPARAGVQVAVEMNFEEVERRTQRMNPDSGVILDESIQSNDSQNGSGGGTGGAPGVRANSPNEGGAGAAPQNSQVKREKTVSNKYHYDTVTETTKQQVGAVRRMGVAVLVRPRVAGEGAERKYETLSKAELDSLAEAIKNAVGFSAQRGDTVTVENAPTVAGPDLALPVLPPAMPPEGLSEWTRLWPDVSTGLAILIVAFVFWRAMKKLSAPAPDFSVTVGDPVSPQSQMAGTGAQGPDGAKVQDLISQNTAQATEIIRSLLQK